MERYRNLGIGRYMILQTVERENLEWIDAETDDDAVGFYLKCDLQTGREIQNYPDGAVVRYHCRL